MVLNDLIDLCVATDAVPNGVSLVQQVFTNDCGLACVKMLADFHNLDISLSALRLQANPDQQVVDKMVSLSAELNSYVVEKIGNTAKELDPQGIKMAQSARKDIVKVAYISQAWMTKIMTGGIHGSGLSGGNMLSKVATIAKPLGNAMDNACGLYNAMHAYTEAKEINLPEETVSISAEDEKI